MSDHRNPSSPVHITFESNLKSDADELASEEQLMDAALPALSIVAIGLVPVLLITRIIIQDKN